MKLTLVVDPTSPLPTPLRNPHPTGTAKGCRVATRDILVLDLVGCIYIYIYIYTYIHTNLWADLIYFMAEA